MSVNRGDFCISKAGVAMATQLWAARLAPEGIVVYEVRPGVIATDMTEAVTAKYDALFDSGAVPIARGAGRPTWPPRSPCSSRARPRTRPVRSSHVDGGMHIPVL